MRRTVAGIAAMKGSGRRISALACYDYSMAALLDRAGVDVLLVGDSAGMVVLGHEGTTQVTMRDMCAFTGAVARARRDALVVADMPFMSYQACAADAVRNAGRLVRAGADAVKLEGGREAAAAVGGITAAGIPVMGHIGLQPQTAALAGGYRAQGRTAAAAGRLVGDARALEGAGAFCVVLEMVAREAARAVTGAVGIPTIGIGSGGGCDGQVLVAHDMLGMYDRVRPRHARRYLDLSGQITGAAARYAEDVAAGRFPADENSVAMDEGEAGRLGGG